MKWLRDFSKGLFTRTQFLVGVGLTTFITSALVFAYYELAITPFTAGSNISAAEMNNKLQMINTRLAKVSTEFAIGLVSDTSLAVTPTAYSYEDFLNPSFTQIYDYSGGGSTGFASSMATYGYHTFTSADEGVYKITFSVNPVVESSYPGSMGLYRNGQTFPFIQKGFGGSGAMGLEMVQAFKNGDSIQLKYGTTDAFALDSETTIIHFKKL